MHQGIILPVCYHSSQKKNNGMIRVFMYNFCIYIPGLLKLKIIYVINILSDKT